MSPIVRTFAVVLIAVLAFRAPAMAQDGLSFGTTDEEEYQESFKALMAHPADEQALARYARAATRIGNLEAAIATLERILALAPDLHTVRIELAVLYARIRAADFARAELDLVIASDAPQDVRDRASRLLAQLDSQDRYGVFTGTVALGARYQANANSGTDSSTIREAGFDFPTPDERREEEDVNGFFLASVSHIYDLGLESRIPLETHAATYWTRHVDVEDVDIGVLEVTSGPRVPLAPASIDRLSVRPFGIFGFSLLHDEWNDTEYGAGVEFEKRIGLHSAAVLSYSGRQRDFDVLRDNTGFTHRVSGAVVMSVTTDIAGAVGASWADESARKSFRSNQEISAFARGTVRYDPPLGLSPWPWHASLQFRWTGTDDDGPDDRVDPFVEREDDEFHVIGRNTFWFTSQLAVFVEAEHVHTDSNLSTGEFDNTTVALGTLFAF